MQSRSPQARQADLHGSSGAKKRRHQDDKAFHNFVFLPPQTSALLTFTQPPMPF